MTDRQALLKEIYKEIAKDRAFDHVRAHAAPKRLVPGRGSMEPRAIFIGEAPGKSEASSFKPFCGTAGRVLDKVLGHISLSRSEIFITNVVKYRPTIGTKTIRNRKPNTLEIITSRIYLVREIGVFDPATPVILMGATALMALGPPSAAISEWHGRGWYDADRAYGAMFHPAVAAYDPGMLDTLLADIDNLKELL
jgi:uracil-DNA glycosylase family 4